MELAPLQLEFERTAGHPLQVILTGEIDFSSAASMQARITGAREREATAELILDLTAVRFIDSSGLGVLLHLQRELESEDGRLVLLCPTAAVRRSMSITGLDRHFVLAESLQAAEVLVAEQASAEEPQGQAPES